MNIIAIANQKGGVGKTTTAVNLGSALAAQGSRVCCLDFDPQCHLAKYLGYLIPNGDPTITDLLFAKASYQPMPDTTGLIRHSEIGLDFIPGSLRLSKADLVLSQAMFRERILSDVLRLVLPPDAYDYLLIDCNPSMGILLTNALAAADEVLIPVQTEEFSVDGLEDMLELVSIINKNINPRLTVLGLLPTMVANNSVSRIILEALNKNHAGLILPGISRSVEAAKSCQQRTPLVAKPSSKLGKQYIQAAQEISRRLEERYGTQE